MSANLSSSNGSYTKEEIDHLMFLTNQTIDAAWVIIGTMMIFLMQIGFAMLETGSVREKNIQNVLLKNVIDTFTGAIAFYLIGYGLMNN